MSKNRFVLSLDISIAKNNLAGGDVEYDPYFAVRASWTEERFSRRTPAIGHDTGATVSTGPLVLPDLDSVRGDECIAITMYPRSTTSGIADIDKRESKYAERRVQAGSEMLLLADVLQYVVGQNGSGEFGVILWERMLSRRPRERRLLAAANNNPAVLANPGAVLSPEKLREIEDEVNKLSSKAILSIKISTNSVDYVRKLLSTIRSKQLLSSTPTPHLSTPILYGTPRYVIEGQRILGRHAELYMWYGTDIPMSPPENVNPVSTVRLGVSPNESLVNALHMIITETKVGDTMPSIFMMQDPSLRPDGKSLIAKMSNDELLQSIHYFSASLMSSMLRSGQNPADFVKVVEKQFGEPRTSSRVYSSYITAVDTVLDIGTFAANQLNYTSDIRFPSKDWADEGRTVADIEGGPPIDPDSGNTKLPILGLGADTGAGKRVKMAQLNTISTLVRHAMNSHHSLGNNESPLAKDKSGDDDDRKKLFLMGESWDMEPLAYETNSGDCEDSAAASINILIAMRAILTQALKVMPASVDPILVAAHRILCTLYFGMFGSSVSAPYADTDGKSDEVAKQEKLKALREHRPLPMIGDAEDLKMNQGGHAHGMAETIAQAAIKYLNGLKITGSADAGLRTKLETIVRTAPAWQLCLSPAVLEGTASTTSRILPMEETFRGTDRGGVYVKKHAAIRDFIYKMHLDYDKMPEMCRIEGVAYESKAQDPNRRASGFYRAFVHGLFPSATDSMHPTLAQSFIVNTVDRTRGVDAGTYFRQTMRGSACNIAYLSHTVAHFTEEAWNREVAPFTEAVLRQMPMSAFARHNIPPSGILAHPLGEQVLRELAVPMEQRKATLGAILDMNAYMTQQTSAGASLVKTDNVLHEISDRDYEIIQNADASDTHAILPLYMAPWRFEAAGQDGTNTFIDGLKQMKSRGLIDAYAIMRDRPLPMCDDVIQVLLAVKVK